MTALRPIYTDNLMHDLKTELFFKPEMINDMNEVGDGAVKTFPLNASCPRFRKNRNAKAV
jgi:hypothetical protein